MEEILVSNYIGIFDDAPGKVRQALCTEDRFEAATNALGLQAECLWQLRTLLAASAENRLLLQTRKNRFTSEVGLIVGESWTGADSQDVWLIAELLGAPGDEWQVQTEYFKRLDWLARRNQLSIVTHWTGGRLTSFVVRMHRTEGRLRFWYLARLLMTGGELAQWSL